MISFACDIINIMKEEARWLKSPRELCLSVPFLKGIPHQIISNHLISYQVQSEKGPLFINSSYLDTFELSNTNSFPDMCQMNVLNQPEVLSNLVKRYKSDHIFTFIGPTLIALNPYRIINQLFNLQVMEDFRTNIIQNNLKDLPPHVYTIAGKAYNLMTMSQSNAKQAIVISGESGAGKTESTKYCMQVLTCLSHKESHPIEKKILACNPLLEAFGNSKTVRNDNSSRFGKYVQIFFSNENTIEGANIISYLLQKSRVVSISSQERTFHAFYALCAAKQYGSKECSTYAYLKQSNCYLASNIDDLRYFKQINQCMSEIGFTKEENHKIWNLMNAILNLGNIQFTDSNHQNNQNLPCQINNPHLLSLISKSLETSPEHLQKILVSETKQILKETTSKCFNLFNCVTTRNTLAKAIYNSIFEFIIFKIQAVLNVQKPSGSFQKSINILDIFGFENFEQNSFQQLCINFTNEKLLKQYNKYIFENEMEILREDGLANEVKDIKPPTNDEIIFLINRSQSLTNQSVSIFSIVNDATNSNQYSDQTIISGFRNKLAHSKFIKFDHINPNQFLVIHSQCQVTYNIEGFKSKNQDKINKEILEIYSKLFPNLNKNQSENTLLKKFVGEIDLLVEELGSSVNHFIRCIKPNEKKMASLADENYILAQIRYLGVFETIQIRQKTFPARRLYEDFSQAFRPIFPSIRSNNPKQHARMIAEAVASSPSHYLCGIKRIYMTKDLQEKLHQKIYQFFKLQNQKAKIIQTMFQKFKFRKSVKKLVSKYLATKQIWIKFQTKRLTKVKRQKFIILNEFSERKKKQIEERKKKEGEWLKKQELQEMRGKLQKQSLIVSKVARKVSEKWLKDFFVKVKIHAANSSKKQARQEKNESLKNILSQATKVSNGIRSENLDESVVIDVDQSSYKRVAQEQPIEKQEHRFNQSFEEGNSIFVSTRPDVIFEKNIVLTFYTPEGGNIQKLQKILAEQYKLQVSGNQQEFFSPNSVDCSFKVEDTPSDLLNRVICFSAEDFFKKVLRKRTTSFLGIQKSYQEILVAKPRPLSKTITLCPESDEEKALKIFKVIVRIGEEAKLDSVFKLIQSMISLCQSTTQELKNQIFIQLLKQSNTSSELASIRIFQCLAVFLHIYTPDQDFLMAGLHIFFNRLGEEKHGEKEEQYLRYLFKKMIRKIENPPVIGYMPIKYQMMALMCKRQISIPIYLPVGNSILIRVESYDTFADIKCRVISEFGINGKRFKAEMFKFFEIVNFENEELEESPLNENQIVWDIMTYWELAKEKYKETNINPPAFFLMMKIVYAFECHHDDVEGIQLSFAQCYFDYFIGRIKLQFDKMGGLAACVKKIKLASRPENEILGSYPIWMAKKYQKQELVELMVENVRQMESEELNFLQMKFRFLEICNECSLAMSIAIPTEQPIKLFFKPKKIYLTEKSNVVEQYSIRNVVKWAIDKEKFVFEIKAKDSESNKTHAIFTQYAHICSQFLYDLGKVIKK